MSEPSTEPSTDRAVAVVVLTGGASRRMGSHKPSLEVGGRPLVARVVEAAAPRPTLVVGHPDGVPDGIPVVGEQPPGGGPVAALAAGVDAIPGGDPWAGQPEPSAPAGTLVEVVVVLAADLPFVTGAHLDRLVASLRTGGDDADVAVTTDASGRENWLCAAWRREALERALARLAGSGRAAAPGGLRGASMRALAAGARVRAVPDDDAVAVDVDTPEQLAAARRRAGQERGSTTPRPGP